MESSTLLRFVFCDVLIGREHAVGRVAGAETIQCVELDFKCACNAENIGRRELAWLTYIPRINRTMHCLLDWGPISRLNCAFMPWKTTWTSAIACNHGFWNVCWHYLIRLIFNPNQGGDVDEIRSLEWLWIKYGHFFDDYRQIHLFCANRQPILGSKSLLNAYNFERIAM